MFLIFCWYIHLLHIFFHTITILSLVLQGLCIFYFETHYKLPSRKLKQLHPLTVLRRAHFCTLLPVLALLFIPNTVKHFMK